ncbi:MAG: CcoQ/FixQ family Cbb3-type cytochrome c oxidase assembly chaperone [Sulfurovum sp.]|nr:CcoQ/FixQ family Cbb3-type cytochrome c oxidase assembly chaperone [Sulfurovum sp.]
MSIADIQAYAYLVGTVIAVFVFYNYIVYLYRSEKRGEKDHEKFGKLALDDDITSKPLVDNNPEAKNEKKEK